MRHLLSNITTAVSCFDFHEVFKTSMCKRSKVFLSLLVTTFPPFLHPKQAKLVDWCVSGLHPIAFCCSVQNLISILYFLCYAALATRGQSRCPDLCLPCLMGRRVSHSKLWFIYIFRSLLIWAHNPRPKFWWPIALYPCPVPWIWSPAFLNCGWG